MCVAVGPHARYLLVRCSVLQDTWCTHLLLCVGVDEASGVCALHAG